MKSPFFTSRIKNQCGSIPHKIRNLQKVNDGVTLGQGAARSRTPAFLLPALEGELYSHTSKPQCNVEYKDNHIDCLLSRADSGFNLKYLYRALAGAISAITSKLHRVRAGTVFSYPLRLAAVANSCTTLAKGLSGFASILSGTTSQIRVCLAGVRVKLKDCFVIEKGQFSFADLIIFISRESRP
jgi:hypothetical protein